MVNINNRFKDTLKPSGSIPFRMDIDLPNNSSFIKSGSGNDQDVPLFTLSTFQTLYGENIVPEIYTGFYFIKSKQNFLPPTDSIILKEYIEIDNKYIEFKLTSLPKTGKPITAEIYGKPKNNQPTIKYTFQQVDEFSKRIIDGVETIIPDKYEYKIDYENNKMVFVKQGFLQGYSIIPNPSITDIKELDVLGYGNGNKIQIFNLDMFPVVGTTLKIYLVDEVANTFTELEVHRNISNIDIQSENVCVASPEFGIIIFGETSKNGINTVVPRVGQSVYASYTAYPYIEYTPMHSLDLHIPEYLDISPASSGISKGFIQISSSQAMIPERLVLTTTAPAININGNVYGPLEVIYDLAYMTCTAYNHYDEPVPQIEITWHMDIDVGTINGHKLNDSPFINFTNFEGNALASYITPSSVFPLENIFGITEYSTDTNNVTWFENQEINIYNSKYVISYLSYDNLATLRLNSNGDGLVKLVSWHTEISENNNEMKYALIIHPDHVDHTIPKIGFSENVFPDYMLYDDWATMYQSQIDNSIDLEIGTKIFDSNNPSVYYECVKIENGTSYNDDTGTRMAPIFTADIGNIIIDSTEQGTDIIVYWECKTTNFTGWTIYTDKLVRVWCTAYNPVTGIEIKSNSIYFEVTVPNSWLGLYGFRFDTIPESLMDKDPLTI